MRDFEIYSEDPFEIAKPIAEELVFDHRFDSPGFTMREREAVYRIDTCFQILDMLRNYQIKTDIAYVVAEEEAYDSSGRVEILPLFDLTVFRGKLTGGKPLKSDEAEADGQPIRTVCLDFDESVFVQRKASSEEIDTIKNMRGRKSLCVPVFSSVEIAQAA